MGVQCCQAENSQGGIQLVAVRRQPPVLCQSHTSIAHKRWRRREVSVRIHTDDHLRSSVLVCCRQRTPEGMPEGVTESLVPLTVKRASGLISLRRVSIQQVHVPRAMRCALPEAESSQPSCTPGVSANNAASTKSSKIHCRDQAVLGQVGCAWCRKYHEALAYPLCLDVPCRTLQEDHLRAGLASQRKDLRKPAVSTFKDSTLCDHTLSSSRLSRKVARCRSAHCALSSLAFGNPSPHKCPRERRPKL